MKTAILLVPPTMFWEYLEKMLSTNEIYSCSNGVLMDESVLKGNVQNGELLFY